MSFSQKPDIEISLRGSDGPLGCYVQSFSTLDKIEGVVSITPRVDTQFEDIEIAMLGMTFIDHHSFPNIHHPIVDVARACFHFSILCTGALFSPHKYANRTPGSTKTYVDKLSTTATMNGRTEASHRFLRLLQPILRSQFPGNGIIEAGRTYTFPFTFVVPTHLLPRACSHKCDNNHVKETHLLLPPSFGDPGLSGYDDKLLDDLAPDMTRVSYSIRVKMTKWNNDGSENVIMEASKKLRIKPTYEEQAPLNIDNDEEYCGRQEKTLRKGFMKGKLGRLVMEAAQPKSFMLPAMAPGDAIPPITTMAKVRLRFDPHEASSPPPRLGSLSSKLKVTTFYASSPRHAFPTRNTTYPDMSQGYISETLQLSSLCVASVDWQRHDPDGATSQQGDLERRDSALSTSSVVSSNQAIPAPSSNYHTNLPYYTANIVVPLSLPANKHFVPTFHSCIVSRVYALGLTLTTHGQPLGPSLSLKLPVQISAEGSINSVERRRLSERAEEAAREADAMFEPRAMGLASMNTQGSDLPPGYERLGFQSHRGGAGTGGMERTAAGVMVTAH